MIAMMMSMVMVSSMMIMIIIIIMVIIIIVIIVSTLEKAIEVVIMFMIVIIIVVIIMIIILVIVLVGTVLEAQMLLSAHVLGRLGLEGAVQALKVTVVEDAGCSQSCIIVGVLRYEEQPSVGKVVSTDQLKVALLLLSAFVFVHSRGEGVNSDARAEEFGATSADDRQMRGVILEVQAVSPVSNTRKCLTCLDR